MKVLMLGWELPPLISGGLGIACQGLYLALRQEGIDVSFVLPWPVHGLTSDSGEIIGAFGTIQPGAIPEQVLNSQALSYGAGYGGIYGENILENVWRFAEVTRRIAQERDFDIIHAHDWTTCRAGIAARQVSGKPLVVQFHSIEYDRALDNPNPQICALEKESIFTADRVIAVSQYSRQQMVRYYGMDSNKVDVVYNGVDEADYLSPRFGLNERHPKTVLFVGRLTAQKGPQYFLLAAEKVLRAAPGTRIIIAGDGDMRSYLENMAGERGIADKIHFAGFLSRFDLDRVYTLASVCVLTSVSEPFGIVALEAMRRGIPVIVSSHAGITEVVQNCVRIDPWDTDSVAGAIVDIINNKDSMADNLAQNAANEVKELTWKKATQEIIGIYQELAVLG